MQVTAAMVRELRQRTGAGMMECKRLLIEAQGDMDGAIELLRKSGQAWADRKSGRTAAEGVVLVDTDGKGHYAMLEINCETDFVARGANFLEFCTTVLQGVLQGSPSDLEALASVQVQGKSVEEARLELVAEVGENIQIRRFRRVTPCGDSTAVYLHGNRIGVLVDMSGGDEMLARDIAMHVAACQPSYISRDDVPADFVEKERSILEAQAQQSGKPAAIIVKIVQGRLNRFFSEITLLGQSFVKEPEQPVEKLLQSRSARVNAFYRFETGEGIEKKQENFAEEVAAQRKAAEAG